MRGCEAESGHRMDFEERQPRPALGRNRSGRLGGGWGELGGGQLQRRRVTPPILSVLERGTAAAAQHEIWAGPWPRTTTTGEEMLGRCADTGRRGGGGRARGDQDHSAASAVRLPPGDTPHDAVHRRGDPPGIAHRGATCQSCCDCHPRGRQDSAASRDRRGPRRGRRARQWCRCQSYPVEVAAGHRRRALRGREVVDGQLAVAPCPGAHGALHYSWIYGTSGRMTRFGTRGWMATPPIGDASRGGAVPAVGAPAAGAASLPPSRTGGGDASSSTDGRC